ncbi:hypothetical protein JOB18_040727 [Solea senegalensis]|uniref:Uncharacterized protein n=1 Tax=Solea senegalensis TaxID=28829 RepID=A0AAV6S8G2_SOLSE|nr:hypothetical protein JOB18_040727 [Solea senegalensis]
MDADPNDKLTFKAIYSIMCHLYNINMSKVPSRTLQQTAYLLTSERNVWSVATVRLEHSVPRYGDFIRERRSPSTFLQQRGVQCAGGEADEVKKPLAYFSLQHFKRRPWSLWVQETPCAKTVKEFPPPRKTSSLLVNLPL